MGAKLDTVKAAVLAVLFAVVLAIMFFVPVWFVMAFFSRLFSGQIHRLTFFVAGAGAVVFLVWVFRLAYRYFRQGYWRRNHA